MNVSCTKPVLLWLLLSSPLAALPRADQVTSRSIDERLARTWREEGLEPGRPQDKDQLQRRLHLDLVGRLPAKPGVDEPFNQQRDRLLASPEFARRWAQILRDWFVGREHTLQTLADHALEAWLEDLIARGVGMDVVVRELLTAEGSPMGDPATVFQLQFRSSPGETGAHVARVLLGSSLQCAQCHDHPFSDWKQTDYEGFAAFFDNVGTIQLPRETLEGLKQGTIRDVPGYIRSMPDRVRTRMEGNTRSHERIARNLASLRRVWEQDQPVPTLGWDRFDEAFEGMRLPAYLRRRLTPRTVPVLLEKTEGDRRRVEAREPKNTMMGPSDRIQAPPMFLGGTRPELADGDRRREALARWITQPENLRFPRVFVNQVWARLMGGGLVEPVDQTEDPDEDTFDDLLDRLAVSFVAGGYDLKALVREITGTEAYTLAPLADPEARGAYRFQYRRLRTLDADELANVTLQATGLDRSASTMDARTHVEFTRAFRQDLREQLLLENRTGSSGNSIRHVLWLLNGAFLNRVVASAPGSRVHRWSRTASPEAAAQDLIWSVFGRPARDEEVRALLGHGGVTTTPLEDPEARRPAWVGILDELQGTSGQAGVWSDRLWALLASTEFATSY